MKDKIAAGANENKMGTAPVPRLMAAMGIPIVLSMMLQAVYNIVDSAFLSNMREAGEQALTALGLAFPVQLLMVAAAIGTGVGANALLSRCLGQGKREKASRVAGNTVFLGAVIFVIFFIFGLAGVPAYVRSQSAGGAVSEISLLMAIDYLQICCCASAGIIFFSVFEKMLQATGRSLYSTVAQIAGAVFNIIFDPILIYGWCGFPEMGVRGAAVATVAGQIVSALAALFFHLRLNTEIAKKMRHLVPSGRIIGEIYAVGLPAILSQALLTVMTYGLNMILGQIRGVGENAITVYGLYCKIQQMIIFAAVGLRDAITPIVSFNQGMRSRVRVRQGIRWGLLYTTVLMAAGTLVIEAAAKPLTGFFSLSDTTFDMCVDCIRIVSLAFVFAGLNIALQGVFQALGCGIESLIVSAGRQVLFILPTAWIFTRFISGGADSSLVWWTFMIGEIITLLCGIAMYARAAKNKINGLEEKS